MAVVTPTDHPKSVRVVVLSKFLLEFFVLSRCFLDFSVGVGAFVIGLSQISSFFSFYNLIRCIATCFGDAPHITSLFSVLQ